MKKLLFWYLRVILFSKVHVRRDGFHVSELRLSFSRVNNRPGFSSGCRPENKMVDPDQNKTMNKGYFNVNMRPFHMSNFIAWHLSGMWCHRHHSWISCLHHVQGEINPTSRPRMWSRRSGRSPALASCSPSSSLSPLLRHPTARRNDLRVYPQTGTHFWNKRWMLTCGDWREER